ncbi:MAG: RHS repeat-associated core domain-containing protein [Acidobacteriota bacterium]
MTATNSYDSFGNATNSGFPTRYQYTRREKDSFTGLQYNRARWYDPNIGRFISEDPIGFGGRDINLYGYVGDHPTMFRDPSGNIIPVLVAGGVIVVVLILTSPSYVNAPGPGDPVYNSQSDLEANALGGAVGGVVASKVLGPVLGRILGSLASRIFSEEAPIACEAFGDAATNSVGKVFKSFTPHNFRANLGEFTGELPADAQAHHVFAQKFRPRFEDVGINIDDPRFGSWWETASHQSNGYQYNLEWERFLRTNPTQNEILNFGQEITGRYGLVINY